tara:strand:- start:62 stop:277 length:216 start_codon:yes stop_codon:yes gene_type:complete
MSDSKEGKPGLWAWILVIASILLVKFLINVDAWPWVVGAIGILGPLGILVLNKRKHGRWTEPFWSDDSPVR